MVTRLILLSTEKNNVRKFRNYEHWELISDESQWQYSFKSIEKVK